MTAFDHDLIKVNVPNAAGCIESRVRPWDSHVLELFPICLIEILEDSIHSQRSKVAV